MQRFRKGTRAGHSRATSIAHSEATSPAQIQSRNGSDENKTDILSHGTIPGSELPEREWADFSMDPVYTIPGERKPPPFKAMLTLPYPCSYNRIGSQNIIPYTVFFATHKVYDFLATDIRRHSDVKIELVRRVECDGRKGPVLAVVPAPDPIDNSDPKPLKLRSPTRREVAKSRQNLFSRITRPLLRPGTSVLPTNESGPEENPEPEKKPKYIRPEKLLPPVPSDEEGGIIAEETVIGREIFTGWYENPEDAIRQKRKLQKSGRQKNCVRPNPADSSGKRRSTSKRAERSSIGGTDATDVRLFRKEGNPQGFIYGKFKLDRNMIVSMCWEGLRVEYFVDVEIRYGTEALACRAALEIYDTLDE